MSALPPILVELKASSGEFMAKMGEARHEVARLGNEGHAHFQRLGHFGKAALLGIGGAAVAVGVYGVEMADKWETAHAKLTQAIENTGQHADAFKGQIAATGKRLESLGYTNAQTADSLAILTTSSGSVTKALQLQTTAADIARFKGVDLSQASFMLSRALQGNSRVLKQLGIDLPVSVKGAESLKVAQHNLAIQERTYRAQVEATHAKHKVTHADIERLRIAHDRLRFAQHQVSQATHAHQIILDALNRRIKGQAIAYSETFAGKLATLRARVEDLGKNIGLWLIPKLMRAAAITQDVIRWFARHATVTKVLAGVIGGALVVAIGAYVASLAVALAQTLAAVPVMLGKMFLWAMGTEAVAAETSIAWLVANAAMLAASLASAAGILLAFAPLIIAVAAVGIAAYELYKHWDAVWGAIKTVVHVAFEWIKRHLIYIALAFGPFGLAIYELAHHWRGLWTGIQAIVRVAWNDVLKPTFRALVATFHAVAAVVMWLVDNVWRREFDAMVTVLRFEWGLIKPVLGFLVGGLTNIGRALSTMFQTVWTPLWDGIQSTVQMVWSVLKPIFDAIKRAINDTVGGVGKVVGLAGKVGGKVGHFLGFAQGTDSAPGGWSVVGENGPELMNVPRGAQIVPNSQVGGSVSGAVNVNVYLDGHLVHRSVQQHDQRYRRRMGRSAFDAA